jgi:hypothetical protein
VRICRSHIGKEEVLKVSVRERIIKENPSVWPKTKHREQWEIEKLFERLDPEALEHFITLISLKFNKDSRWPFLHTINFTSQEEHCDFTL